MVVRWPRKKSNLRVRLVFAGNTINHNLITVHRDPAQNAHIRLDGFFPIQLMEQRFELHGKLMLRRIIHQRGRILM